MKRLLDHLHLGRLGRPAIGRSARHLLRHFLCACSLAVALAACSGDEVVLPCPQLQMLKDTDRLVKFVGDGRDLTDVEYEAALRAPFMSCDYDDDVIEALVIVNLVALRGPADEDRVAEIAYFVAVTNANNRDVIREEFTVQIPFEGNQTQIVVTEEVAPRIPLQAEESAADYRIYVGLRLTPDELQYNQENR